LCTIKFPKMNPTSIFETSSKYLLEILLGIVSFPKTLLNILFTPAKFLSKIQDNEKKELVLSPILFFLITIIPLFYLMSKTGAHGDLTLNRFGSELNFLILSIALSSFPLGFAISHNFISKNEFNSDSLNKFLSLQFYIFGTLYLFFTAFLVITIEIFNDNSLIQWVILALYTSWLIILQCVITRQLPFFKRIVFFIASFVVSFALFGLVVWLIHIDNYSTFENFKKY
jgi:hypothetical protein